MTLTCTCHCGNVEITLPQLPETAVSCNCSICRRLGTWWTKYEKADVSIVFNKQPSVGYIWGDRCIEFQHCPICASVTHYTGTSDYPSTQVAINARMLSLPEQQNIHIRHFDGADSWTFLDE
ncbi:GFA family protein [Gynuella sp.]|uniref:GFA family protein n=1 Tax=Gynuella sp. TaxID=2969146 RepID=UPI003D13B51B